MIKWSDIYGFFQKIATQNIRALCKALFFFSSFFFEVRSSIYNNMATFAPSLILFEQIWAENIMLFDVFLHRHDVLNNLFLAKFFFFHNFDANLSPFNILIDLIYGFLRHFQLSLLFLILSLNVIDFSDHHFILQRFLPWYLLQHL